MLCRGREAQLGAGGQFGGLRGRERLLAVRRTRHLSGHLVSWALDCVLLWGTRPRPALWKVLC